MKIRIMGTSEEVQELAELLPAIMRVSSVSGEYPNRGSNDVRVYVDGCIDKNPFTQTMQHYGYEFKAHDSLEDTKATLYCYYKFKKELSNKFFDNRSIDFIIQYSKKEEQAKTVGSLVLFDSEHIGRYVLVRSSIKEYSQNLLINNKNQLVDSHCTCLDCLDGGNRICKHVVATLMYIRDTNPDVYQSSREQQNTLLRLKKGGQKE